MQRIYCQLVFRVKSVLQNRLVSALIFPVLQESDLVRREALEERECCTVSAAEGLLEKLHLKSMLAGNEKYKDS